MREAISSGDAEAVQQLLANGADPHFVEVVPGRITVGLSPQGRYPTIGLCIHHDQPHLIPLFIDAGADPHGFGCAGFFGCLVYTHSAAQNGQTETLRHLIAAGVDVDRIVPNYPLFSSPVTTPLGVALTSGQLQTARFLLDNGANPSSQIFAAQTAEAMDLLIEYGATINGVRIPQRISRQV